MSGCLQRNAAKLFLKNLKMIHEFVYSFWGIKFDTFD